MEDKLIEILQSFGHPVKRQGSMAENEKYPNTFFTFWNNSESEQTSHDNDTTSVVYNYDVNIYSSNPETAFSLLREARILLKNNGFTIISRGYDVASDETSHIGRGMNVAFLKYEN